mgnify:CR=1 FL=1
MIQIVTESMREMGIEPQINGGGGGMDGNIFQSEGNHLRRYRNGLFSRTIRPKNICISMTSIRSESWWRG